MNGFQKKTQKTPKNEMEIKNVRELFNGMGAGTGEGGVGVSLGGCQKIGHL